MEQLKLKDIIGLYVRLRESGMSEEDVLELPIYIGNDDELNGVHTAWYCIGLDSEDKDEDMSYLVDVINEDSHNRKLNGKGILIS